MLKMIGNLWKKSPELKVNGKISLFLYESMRSSLRVAIADVPGPMVKGKISFGLIYLVILFIFLNLYLLF